MEEGMGINKRETICKLRIAGRFFFFLFGNIETFFIKNFESIRVTDENRREVYLSKRSSLSFNVSEIHA